ncbi:uncharacterized protein LOC134451272 [Engraulis encrasicolus]|uniref:uncharacterized protein LOC134451272 n=1 Tax=Engraulis encrasicolus TaxID=184585 RepID=UPI002FD59130
MIRASECHSLNGHYGLRRTAVLPKRLQDYYVEGLSLSKKKCVHTMTNGANGHSSTIQAPLHQPVSTEATCNSSCGPLILRIKRTGLPGSRCGFISEFVIPSTREGLQTTVGGSKPTQPLISRNEQAADVAQAAEIGVGSQVDKEIPVVPKAPLQETLEIASILLSLGQPVHQQSTVQQGEPTFLAAPVAQHGKFRVHQDHTYCKQHAEASAISGHVDSSEAKGRRKKLVNPCHIVPCEVQTPALHVQLSGPQNVCRSGLDTQPGASGGDTASCETKGRRRKLAKPRCAMPSKVQKQAPKALNDLPAAPVCSQASFAGLPYSLNQVLGIPQTPCHGFIGGKDQHDGKKFSPQDINIPFEWSSSPREREDMFFPHLDDSSYKAEAAERKRREAALQSSLRQLKEPLDERYIKNAAVLPDLRQPTSAPASIQNLKPSFSNGPQLQEEPLRIHGYNVEDFKRIYHSVVDPKLTTKSGNACRYDLQMGRVIKQRMWEKFNCPSFVETVDADGRVQISESYCSPTLKPHAPVFEVDISEEPLPEQPKRKRARR